MDDRTRPLHRKLILIAEADGFQAGYLSSAITRAGGNVLGPVSDAAVGRALIQRARTMPDAAIVNLALDHEPATPLLVELAGRGVPLILIGAASQMPDAVSGIAELVPSVHAAHQLVDALLRLPLGEPAV